MTMPDIQLMTPEQAQVALQKAGYERTPSIEDWTCSDTTEDGRIVEPGRICYQKPAPGQGTGSKLPITIRVQDKNPYEGEKHKEKWAFMPDVKGKTIDQARAALKAEGITVEPVLVVKAGCAAKTVCDTLPAAEARTGLASEKLLFVGN